MIESLSTTEFRIIGYTMAAIGAIIFVAAWISLLRIHRNRRREW